MFSIGLLDDAKIRKQRIAVLTFILVAAVVNLAGVKKLIIGFGIRGSSQSSGEGWVYFDDIRLYPPRCIPEFGPVGDVSGDCVVSLEDLERITSEWLDDTDVTADFYPDNKVDFKDYAILADNWLFEQLWPE